MCTGSLASNNVPQINSSPSVLNSKEIEIHVYGIRQTANGKRQTSVENFLE